MSDKSVSPIKYFLAGGVGGLGTVLIGHPFDTVKVRMQTMPAPLPGAKPQYTGSLDCARKTFTREGLRGFYKGMTAPLVAVVPIFALSFFGYGLGKRLQQKRPDEGLSNRQIFAAGAFSGFFTTIIMAPGERIKALLQIQTSQISAKYRGTTHALSELYKEGGVRSLYKGTVATLLRDVPGTGVYFVTYEVVKKHCPFDSSEGKMKKFQKVLWTMFAGAMAGGAMWIIATPPDVLKSRQQTAPKGQYNSLVDVYSDLIREAGPKGLYKGIVPVLFRALPANAACFLCFELAMTILNWQFPGL